jgi:curved DNA-binding protein CbpA
MGMSHFSGQSFYEILEITPSATQEEIQKAFFKAKSTYSTSSPALYSVFSEDEAREILRLIDEAYSVLSNYQKRKSYDESLKGADFTSEKSSGSTSDNVTPITRANEALPDFMMPSSGSQTTFSTPITASSPQPTLSKISQTEIREKNGYGKTIISHYNVDPQVENEIKNQETFDGTYLQRVRLYKNISLDALSETSRISRPYLLALETNDYRSLPAPVYTRGFVVSVARLLGLEERKVADSYMRLFKEVRG